MEDYYRRIDEDGKGDELEAFYWNPCIEMAKMPRKGCITHFLTLIFKRRAHIRLLALE